MKAPKPSPDIDGVEHDGNDDIDVDAIDQRITIGYMSDETEDDIPLTCLEQSY